MKSDPTIIRSVASLFKKLLPSQVPVMAPRAERYSGIEALESRIAPALLVSVSGGVLKITGDATDNDLTISGDVGSQTTFSIASAETINGNPGPLVVENVKNIIVNMGDGDDTVTFSSAVSIVLNGSLTVNGGNGANDISATSMTIQKNLTITNGNNTMGSDDTTFKNSNIGGNVTVKNGNGDSGFYFDRDTGGNSTIGGNVSITNGEGSDYVYFGDTNFKKSITVKNGLANTSTSVAGYFNIYNNNNTIFNSSVLGSISVTYLNGTIDYDGIWDTEVMGNVTFNYGETTSKLYIDGYSVATPVVIHGNLTIKGKGNHYIDIGTQYQESGLIVGKNLAIQTGAGADTVIANMLTVRGATKLLLGDGANSTTIDDSQFFGALQLTGGIGVDTLNIETATTAVSDFATTFQKAAKFDLKAGADSVTFTGGADVQQAIVYWNKVSVLGSEVTSRDLTKEFSPFGYQIEVI